MTYQQVLNRLDYFIYHAGSECQFARQHGLSPQYVNDVKHQRRHAGPKMLAALGVEQVVSYRYCKEQGTCPS